MKVSNTLLQLEKLYDKFNTHFWEGALEPCAIVIKPSDTGKELGYHTNKKVWSSTTTSDEFFEIGISSEFLCRPKYEVAGTILHEMVHQYSSQYGFIDCHKRQHTEEFKLEAERVLLEVTKVKGVGWGFTQATKELKQLVDTFDIDWSAFEYLYCSVVPEKPKKSKPKYVYTNPLDEKEKLRYKRQIKVIDVDTNTEWDEEFQDE